MSSIPKKKSFLKAYLDFNVLYKILIGLVVGASSVSPANVGKSVRPSWYFPVTAER